MTIYRIRNWNELFENNRTRELKRLEWVPVPSRMDSLTYSRLVDHPNAGAHLGAWLAILLIASRQEPRGQLPQDIQGVEKALASISRLPVALFEEVLPRLVELQLIERIAGIPQEGATFPQEGAVEGNRREGKGRESAARFVSGADRPTPIKLNIENKTVASELLIRFPGAENLPGEPDDIILGKCLFLANDSAEGLAAALRRIYLAGKKPSTSWAWFPVVLEQYLKRPARREERRA